MRCRCHDGSTSMRCDAMSRTPHQRCDAMRYLHSATAQRKRCDAMPMCDVSDELPHAATPARCNGDAMSPCDGWPTGRRFHSIVSGRCMRCEAKKRRHSQAMRCRCDVAMPADVRRCAHEAMRCDIDVWWFAMAVDAMSSNVL